MLNDHKSVCDSVALWCMKLSFELIIGDNFAVQWSNTHTHTLLQHTFTRWLEHKHNRRIWALPKTICVRFADWSLDRPIVACLFAAPVINVGLLTSLCPQQVNMQHVLVWYHMPDFWKPNTFRKKGKAVYGVHCFLYRGVGLRG